MTSTALSPEAAFLLSTMLSSLLRPKKPRAPTDRAPFPSPFDAQETTPFLPNRPRRRVDIDNEDDDGSVSFSHEEEEEEDEEELNDEDGGNGSLLPIFSASHLGAVANLFASRINTRIEWLMDLVP